MPVENARFQGLSIDYWLLQSEDFDIDTRRQAIEPLIALGVKSSRAREALVRLCGDGNADISLRALKGGAILLHLLKRPEVLKFVKICFERNWVNPPSGSELGLDRMPIAEFTQNELARCWEDPLEKLQANRPDAFLVLADAVVQLLGSSGRHLKECGVWWSQYVVADARVASRLATIIGSIRDERLVQDAALVATGQGTMLIYDDEEPVPDLQAASLLVAFLKYPSEWVWNYAVFELSMSRMEVRNAVLREADIRNKIAMAFGREAVARLLSEQRLDPPLSPPPMNPE